MIGLLYAVWRILLHPWQHTGVNCDGYVHCEICGNVVALTAYGIMRSFRENGIYTPYVPLVITNPRLATGGRVERVPNATRKGIITRYTKHFYATITVKD